MIKKWHINTRMIHPELRLRGSIIRFFIPYFTEKKFRMMNAFMDLFFKGKIKSGKADCREAYVKRADGSELRLCIYSGKNQTGKVPGVLWIHGGGYAIGVPEIEIPFVNRLMGKMDCVIVSPDYTRSTEAPYPAAIEDCYLALLWMKEHARECGIRENQLFTGGESAGGGLAAALSLLARDRGEVAIAFQMLLYPMLDDRMVLESARNNDAPVWNTKSNACAWKLYLGQLYGSDEVPAYAAPARACDYRNMPPTCTMAGTIEPFFDETREYVKRLKESGTKVRFKEFPECYHGFDIVASKSSVGKAAIQYYRNAFRYAAEHFFAEQKKR